MFDNAEYSLVKQDQPLAMAERISTFLAHNACRDQRRMSPYRDCRHGQASPYHGARRHVSDLAFTRPSHGFGAYPAHVPVSSTRARDGSARDGSRPVRPSGANASAVKVSRAEVFTVLP